MGLGKWSYECRKGFDRRNLVTLVDIILLNGDRDYSVDGRNLVDIIKFMGDKEV